MVDRKSAQEAQEHRKPTTLKELLPQDEMAADEQALLAKLTGADGKLKVDLSMPDDYEVEVQAAQLAEHLTAYSQNRQAWRSARSSGDQGKAQQLFAASNYNQLCAAIIQSEFPAARKVAEEIMAVRAKATKEQRRKALAHKDED